MILLIFATLTEAIQLYNTGNKYYAEGNFKSAIECYEKALSICKNKDIYYNLGNASFKAGMIGKAILQYRRGYYLCPRDEDIQYNLNFLRNFRADRLSTIPNPFIKILDRVFHYFSASESVLLSTITFFLVSILFSLFLITRNKIFFWLCLPGSLIFIYFLIVFSLWHSERASNSAVVVVSELKAYSGPGDEYKEIFIIHDGTEAKIREERNGYYLIQLPGGIGGWVENDGIERVFE